MGKRVKSRDTKQAGGIFGSFNEHVLRLNSSKFFAGIVMLMLNLGSKFITIQLSKSQEAYMKYTLSRQLLIFSIAWIGSRDIYISLALTAIFVVLADFLFNENSKLCVLPKKFKEISKYIDTDGDGIISNDELNQAINVLKKAKVQKDKNAQANFVSKFNNNKI
jgi:hypothetical protein